MSPLVAFTTATGSITGAVNCGALPGACPPMSGAGVAGVVSNAAALGGAPRAVIGYGAVPAAGSGGVATGAGVPTGIVADGTTLGEYTVGDGVTVDAAGTPGAVWSNLAGMPGAALAITSTAV